MYPKQLYYKKGRRYVEFQPPLTPSQLVYYQDHTGDFIPLCDESARWFNGYPSEGIWIVRKNSRSCVGDFKITSRRLALEEYREQITEAFTKEMEKRGSDPISNHDIISCVLNSLTGINITDLESLTEKAVLLYVNWICERTGNPPSDIQIEEFKKDSLESIKIYVKKGYSLKDAFSKVVNGYSK
jgi:hypothetical protein